MNLRWMAMRVLFIFCVFSPVGQAKEVHKEVASGVSFTVEEVATNLGVPCGFDFISAQEILSLIHI